MSLKHCMSHPNTFCTKPEHQNESSKHRHFDRIQLAKVLTESKTKISCPKSKSVEDGYRIEDSGKHRAADPTPMADPAPMVNPAPTAAPVLTADPAPTADTGPTEFKKIKKNKSNLSIMEAKMGSNK